MLINAYKQIGKYGYEPTKEDVKVWMIMADENQDGKVSLDEYENLVIKSLKNAGFKMENDKIVF